MIQTTCTIPHNVQREGVEKKINGNLSNLEFRYWIMHLQFAQMSRLWPHKWDAVCLWRQTAYLCCQNLHVYLLRQVWEMINESLWINASWSIFHEFAPIVILRLNRYRLPIATALKKIFHTSCYFGTFW